MYYLEPNKDYRTNSPRTQSTGLLQDIIHYYEDCHELYLNHWCNEETLAFHYGYWDSAEPYQHQQSLLNMNAFLYEKAGIKSTDVVLDAGCGVGGSSIWMAKHHHNKVTGITICEKQILAAREFAKKHQVSELTTFEVANYLETPFPDESFDVVWAAESMCHSLNKADFLKEAYRLLRPNGRLMVSDTFMMQRELDEEQWQTFITLLNGWATPNLCILDDFQTMLVDYKFHAIQQYNIGKYTWPSVDFMYQQTKRFMPLTKLLKWLGINSPALVGNEDGAIAQYDISAKKIACPWVFTATK